MTNPIPTVYAKIADVMAAMSKEGIGKTRKNQQQGYNFRGIDDVYNALSSVLSAHRLVILPRVVAREQVERQSKSGSAMFYTTLTVEFDFVSADDGSKHTITMVGEAMDSADKSSNKAQSAAMKYACLQAFCIPTEGDNDADATTHEVAPRAQRAEEPQAHNPREARGKTLFELARKPRANGGCEMSVPHFKNWIKRLWGVDGLLSLTDAQMADAEELIGLRAKDENTYESRVFELVKEGRVKDAETTKDIAF